METHLSSPLSSRETQLLDMLRAKNLVPLFERLGINLEENPKLDLPSELDVCVIMSDIVCNDISFRPDIGIIKHPKSLTIHSDPALGVLNGAHRSPPTFGQIQNGKMINITRPRQGTRECYLVSPPLLMVNKTLEKIEDVFT